MLSQALLAFKAGITNADSVPQLQNWTSPTADPCAPLWPGVICTNGAVTTL